MPDVQTGRLDTAWCTLNMSQSDIVVLTLFLFVKVACGMCLES